MSSQSYVTITSYCVFKSSAAHLAEENSNSQRLFNTKDGLIQVVIDNYEYDANISPINGLKSTHALVMLMRQSTSEPYLETDQDGEH